MNFLSWLRNSSSVRQKALRVYRHGRKRARNKDYERAIADFTEAIDTVAVPTDVKAMAFYHRAISYLATGNKQMGMNDLDTVLVMEGALTEVNIKTMARQMLARIKSQS